MLPLSFRAWLYPLSIFLGAFLLFQIQPMIGRYLLPFFGGSVSVWGASLVFFTGMLFFGYLYVYLLHTLSIRKQAQIHIALLAVAMLFVVGATTQTESLYLIPEWIFTGISAPVLQVLLALTLSIGIPYFILATTSPLLQQWFGATGKDPYHLYALSNLGSLLALGLYPFVVEPLFPLSTQQIIWTAFFLIFGGLCILTAFQARNSRSEVEAHERAPWRTIEFST